MNPFGVPGYSVQEFAEKQKNNDSFILLDVREPHELTYANFGDDAATLPLSVLARQGLTSAPEGISADSEKEIIVACHHGNRSAQVTAWLRQQGWENVYNLDGGIDAYAVYVDQSIRRY